MTAAPLAAAPAAEELLLDRIRQSVTGLLPMDRGGLLPIARLAIAARLDGPIDDAGDARWRSVPEIGRLLRDGCEGFDDETRVQLAFDDAAIYARVVCRGPRGRTVFADAWWDTDTVEIFLDPTHDHEHYLQFAVLGGGQLRALRARRCMDNQRCENKRRDEPLTPDAWRGSRTLEPDGWTAFAAIPWALVGGAPGPGRTMGFNLLRHRSAGFGAATLFNATTQGPHAPWAWADLALGAPALHVARIDLGELRLWENRGVLSVENRSAAALACTLAVTVRSGEREDCLHNRSSTPALIPAGSTATGLPFAFPLDPEDWKWNRLDLALVDRSGTTLWSATFRLGYGNTWLLHLDDRREGPRAPAPIPGAPDFMAAKRRQIMQAQPRFRRITTAQGAASDFTLAAEDGSVRFDLMRAGELQTIADWLYGRYDSDVDRLLGALFFLHQPSVIRYCNAATAIADGLGPLSALRFGAGQCSVHAEALCGILEKMRCAASGRPYRTTRVTTHAHVTTLAEFEDRWVFLDPSIGRFYFLRDDRTLASLQDLLADPALAARGAKHMDEYLRATNENPDLPNFYRAHATVWPAGAPPE